MDHKMIETGDTVLLGVSGGPDSVALLRGLLELQQELNIKLAIAHLNHGVRGEESDRDARFVKEMGETLQIKTLIEKKDAAAEQVTSKTSFQETARHLRLEFFERTMQQAGANKIALGHTLDDQAETVLMNLLRGSGLKGIGGMSPVRHPYIRPLFYCSRSEVIDFLSDRKIPYCKDSSNEKTDYLRNRIRLELIPSLQEKYNPRITENLFEASEIFRVENDYLNTLVDQEFDRAVSFSGDGETLNMNIEYFTALPLALKRRLVRKGIQSIKGDLRKISFFHIQEVLHLFEKTHIGKRLDLPDNLGVFCRGDNVEFKRIQKTDSSILEDKSRASDWFRLLNIPGETQVEIAGLTLKAEIIDPVETGYSAGHTNQAFLDFDKTGGNIMIRFFQAGDRLKPLGMQGTKKLKSIFIDEKVPQEIRSTVPILTTGNNDIIWVYGTRIAHDYRVTSDTSKVLFIKGLS
ncbi:MAG: tRNA lysidine(34) synthetase TilS [Nitrospinota bacterium]|nr:tRNA lysidine(34) synthetase TilS [Nitrospinota bacterium]